MGKGILDKDDELFYFGEGDQTSWFLFVYPFSTRERICLRFTHNCLLTIPELFLFVMTCYCACVLFTILHSRNEICLQSRTGCRRAAFFKHFAEPLQQCNGIYLLFFFPSVMKASCVAWTLLLRLIGSWCILMLILQGCVTIVFLLVRSKTLMSPVCCANQSLCFF